jgi:predicted transcriptional regulator
MLTARYSIRKNYLDRMSIYLYNELMDVQNSLRRKIKQLIDDEGGQAKFSKKTGIDEAVISKWLSGKRKINLGHIQRISKTYNIPIKNFL